MAGIKALRKLQFGRETTSGTISAPTFIWRGMGTIEDKREVKFPNEDVGYLGGTSRSYIPKYEGGLLIESVPATFEMFPHILEMGIKTATPAIDGTTGSGYIYAYAFPTTAPNVIKTYTIEGGDNQEAEVMEYCHVTDFTLTGDERQVWNVGANITGRQVALQAFTGAITVPTAEEMLFQKTKLYIDAIGGSWGGTQQSNTLIAAQLSVKTGMTAKWTADGELYFSFVQTLTPEIRLRLTFEHDTPSTAQKVNWRAQTPVLVRLDISGSTLATPGTLYSTKKCLIDLAGKWESFKKIGDRNGNDVLEGEFVARYDSTGAKFGTITVVNTLSALP
jgi:hypothetical protein